MAWGSTAETGEGQSGTATSASSGVRGKLYLDWLSTVKRCVQNLRLGRRVEQILTALDGYEPRRLLGLPVDAHQRNA